MYNISYSGCESFDVVLYIARTITKLKHRVLLIDLSETGALLRSIKHSMELDSQNDIVNYRDINYIRKYPSEKEMKEFQNGVIIVVHNFKYNNDHPIPFNMVNVVVNPYPHIIDKVSDMIKSSPMQENNVRLLVRDILTQDDIDRVKISLSLPPKVENVSYLYVDNDDISSSIECQINQVVRFTNISSRMKKYIIDQVQVIFPKENSNKIKKAFVEARKGV